MAEPYFPDPPRALDELQQLIGHHFETPGLLHQALIHRSFSNEHPGISIDNERMEFLGDAVLELVVSTWLYQTLPDSEEGPLTATKSRLVREESLARLARKFELGDFLLLGRGEESSGGRTKDSLLSDAFEAVVAALYLDVGYSQTSDYIQGWFGTTFGSPHDLVQQARDPRSRLQEIVQGQFNQTPDYTIEGRVGPDHDAQYRARVEVQGFPPQSGEGPSKKHAKRTAAERMLEIIARSSETKEPC